MGIGSLLVGINAAKAFAFANDIPIVGVHHIAGHIYANAIEQPLEFPLIALVVSGGHTELILMKDHYQFEKLGETMDDAIGDRLAHEGKLNYQMPDLTKLPGFMFSFSGIKSHVINLVHNANQRNEEIVIEDLCASFQETVTEVLVQKSINAIKEYNAKMFIVAGGVAANKGLRR